QESVVRIVAMALAPHGAALEVNLDVVGAVRQIAVQYGKPRTGKGAGRGKLRRIQRCHVAAAESLDDAHVTAGCLGSTRQGMPHPMSILRTGGKGLHELRDGRGGRILRLIAE